MKNLFIGIIVCFCFFSCDEIPPDIGSESGVDPIDPTEVVRKVLIEEFTGVRCVNCPAGSEAIEQLLDIHGDKLVAVSIHSGFFSVPYEESKYDFRSEDGDNVLELVGQPIGYPTGVVSRKIFDGEDELQLGKTKWAGTIDQELSQEASVKLDFTSSYNIATREVSFFANMQYLKNLEIESPRLTIYLTEDGIEDYQITPEGKQSDYLHKHVFRQAVTPYDGDVLDGGTEANTMLEKTYTFTLPDSWDESKVNAIAFIHNGGSTKEIIQVAELHVAQ